MKHNVHASSMLFVSKYYWFVSKHKELSLYCSWLNDIDDSIVCPFSVSGNSETFLRTGTHCDLSKTEPETELFF